jgi:hypothetical protein
MTLQEITFIGTYTYTAQDFRDTARRCSTAASARSTGPRRARCPTGARAFADIRAGRVAAPKIILKPMVEETFMSNIPTKSRTFSSMSMPTMSASSSSRG